MKFFGAALILSQLWSSKAINPNYKQSGSQVDRSKRTKRPSRQNGKVILKKFKDTDELSFKLSKKDNATVTMLSDNEDLDFSIAEPGKNQPFKKLDTLKHEGKPVQSDKKENPHGKAVNSNRVKMELGEGGELKIKAEVKGQGKGVGKNKRSLQESSALVILDPGSAHNICFEIASLVHYVSEPVTLRVALCDAESEPVFGSNGDGVVFGSLTVSIADVGGDDSTVQIHASDENGWSHASFTPNTSGLYSITIDIDASFEGESFERQAHDVILVSERQIESVESVSLGMVGDSAHLTVQVELADGYTPNEESDTFIVHADIVDSEGRDIMTASAMADLNTDNTLQLVIQPDWFEGFELSHFLVEYLRISNVEGTVPLIVAENISIDTTTSIIVRNRRLSEMPQERELRMTQGVPPPRLPHGGNVRRLQSSSTVFAVHGYCSGAVEWEENLEGLIEGCDIRYFRDTYQSRSNHDFALRVKWFAENTGYSYSSGNPCSFIAHSQGGMAVLTLYTHWWTCLDNSDHGYLIQSVGTPYQGTALAVLGDAMGGLSSALGQPMADCSTVLDLTELGASAWLTTIPNWARAMVHYYTTSRLDSVRICIFGFCDTLEVPCSSATDPFLDHPNDGIVEMSKGQLPGGQNMGHHESECHATLQMTPPAQYQNIGRNKLMVRMTGCSCGMKDGCVTNTCNGIYPICSGRSSDEYCDGLGDCDGSFCNCFAGREFCEDAFDNPCPSAN